MAMLGPMVVVAETPAADLVDVLGKAGAFPIVEASFADAPAAIAEIQPAALVLADDSPCTDEDAKEALIRKIDARRGPFMPVLARMQKDGGRNILPVLPKSGLKTCTRRLPIRRSTPLFVAVAVTDRIIFWKAWTWN